MSWVGSNPGLQSHKLGMLTHILEYISKSNYFNTYIIPRNNTLHIAKFFMNLLLEELKLCLQVHKLAVDYESQAPALLHLKNMKTSITIY